MNQTQGECALCGHWLVARDGEVIPRCGIAQAWWNDTSVGLCHTDDHSCYTRWTVFGDRPTQETDPTEPDPSPPDSEDYEGGGP